MSMRTVSTLCLLVSALANEEALVLMQVRAARITAPSPEQLLSHSGKLSKFSEKVFNDADLDKNNILDLDEVKAGLQRAFHPMQADDEMVNLVQEQAGDDHVIQLDEFVRVVKGAAQILVERQGLTDVGVTAGSESLAGCKVSLFAGENCEGEAYASVTLSGEQQKVSEAVVQPHEVHSYTVEGTQCGDVELWDDEEEDSCSADNEWWDGQALNTCITINDVTAFDIIDDISGVSIFQQGGGASAHCSAALLQMPTPDQLLKNDDKLNKYAQNVFTQVDVDSSSALDENEVNVGLARAFSGVPEYPLPGNFDAAAMVMNLAGEDQLVQQNEFVRVVRGAAELLMSRQASASGDEVASQSEVCRVSLFADEACTGEPYDFFTILGENNQKATHNAPIHEVKSYMVTGTLCGDVELWDDEDHGECSPDNVWWTHIHDHCITITEFDMRDDVGGVTLFTNGGGRDAHC